VGIFILLGGAMRTGEQLSLIYPVYVAKQSVAQPKAFVQGNVAALALFSDFDAACDFAEPGMWLQRFDTPTELVTFLRGLTGDHTHVVLDPMDGKRAGFVKLVVFIENLAASGQSAKPVSETTKRGNWLSWIFFSHVFLFVVAPIVGAAINSSQRSMISTTCPSDSRSRVASAQVGVLSPAALCHMTKAYIAIQNVKYRAPPYL
jgi:hypothetical protein